MNYGISVLFRAIPLLMAGICFGYGAFIMTWGEDVARFTAGPIVFSLGAICLALFATAAVIIRQIIHTYNKVVAYVLPICAYLIAFFTVLLGVILASVDISLFVPGHVVSGVGLIALCVSTAATSSTRFELIPQNSAAPEPTTRNPKGFSVVEERLLEAVVILVAGTAWIWSGILVSYGESLQHLVAGTVMGGLACICTCLVALVFSIARQVSGVYTMSEKSFWIWLVLLMGSLAVVWGLFMIFSNWGETIDFVGFVMIGLGLICFSISSKVILLAKIWRASFALASRIPIIPVMTALTCLFLAAFLFEEALYKPKFFVPARVLTGLGAICFTLFSIVSILESGTKKK